jgi:hypothetical protein
MLVIKVELWPYGDESRAEQIATGVIANDGTGTAEVGRYVSFFAHGDMPASLIASTLQEQPGGVRVHHRRRESVWRLVHKALYFWMHKSD